MPKGPSLEMLMLLGEIARPYMKELLFENFIRNNPHIANALVDMRLHGKGRFSVTEADKLVSFGVFAKDEQGYYISERAEEFIDRYIMALNLLMNPGATPEKGSP
jgi:hypothetical protein